MKGDTMINLTTPLNLEGQDFLSNLQGNILKSHGRSYAVHLMLRFDRRCKNTARAWIKHFAESKVTSAYEQQQQVARRRARIAGNTTGEEELFASVLLSAAGYRALEFTNGVLPNDENGSFAGGMANGPLTGPPPDTWDEPYKSGVDAMILLAHEDYSKLMAEVRSVETQLSRFCEDIYLEEGKKMVKRFGWRKRATIEHFGYADGISQENQDEKECADIALVAEPNGNNYGSFMVFQKLEQNVRKFDELITDLAQRLEISKDKAGAYTVGRYPDGTPLIDMSVQAGETAFNDFNFDGDEGQICPFHAHIRKMNPRGDLEHNLEQPLPPELRKGVQIVRRGITYGDRPDLYSRKHKRRARKLPTGGVGLLFISFQSKLEDFEILQIRANHENFIRPGVGLDALIGYGDKPSPQSWPYKEDKIEFLMADLVSLKGGEYFFAPSLSFLKDLYVDEITEEQGKALIQATKQLYQSKKKLKDFGRLWSAGKRIEAMEELGVSQEDFDKFYAYLVPYMSLLDAYTAEPYELRIEGHAGREVEGPTLEYGEVEGLDEGLTSHVVEAFTSLFNPIRLEEFSLLWSQDPEQALVSIGLSREEGDAFYGYLDEGGVNFRFGWPW
jgi:Dyp-type peroxidase family